MHKHTYMCIHIHNEFTHVQYRTTECYHREKQVFKNGLWNYFWWLLEPKSPMKAKPQPHTHAQTHIHVYTYT